MLRFLRDIMASAREWQKYQRAVRHTRQAHLSLDLIIYAIKKVQQESTVKQNLTVTFTLSCGSTLTVAVNDKTAESKTLDHEEQLFADHQRELQKRYGMGAF